MDPAGLCKVMGETSKSANNKEKSGQFGYGIKIGSKTELVLN